MIAAVHAHVCMWRPEETLCFETGSLIGLELLDKTSLTSQRALGTSSALLPQS